MLKSGYEEILLGTRELGGQNQSHTLSWKNACWPVFSSYLDGGLFLMKNNLKEVSVCPARPQNSIISLAMPEWR